MLEVKFVDDVWDDKYKTADNVLLFSKKGFPVVNCKYSGGDVNILDLEEILKDYFSDKLNEPEKKNVENIEILLHLINNGYTVADIIRLKNEGIVKTNWRKKPKEPKEETDI